MEDKKRDEFRSLADELNAKFADSGDQITPKMVDAAVKNFERVEKMRKGNGKYRVLGIDKFSHEDWAEGEYDTREEALRVARTKTNEAKKNCFGDNSYSVATVYYAYDVDGSYIGGDTWTGE